MKLTLLKKFSILSFLVIGFLAIVLAFSFSRFSENQLMELSAQHTADTAKILISYSLLPEDFEDTISDKRYEVLYEVFKNNVLSDDIKHVKVWNKEGRIVFSDNKDAVGAVFPINAQLRRALRGYVTADFMDEKDRQNQFAEYDRHQKYVEVFVPIILKTGENKTKDIFGVLEVHQEATPLYKHIVQGQKFGWFFILISFTALYVSLYQIVKKASRTIEEQGNALSELTGRLDETMKNQEQTYVGTIKALLTALDAKDKYTAGHCSRVTDYAVLIGRVMGLEEEKLKNIEEAGLFHDIGKIGIPEHILNKKDTLTNDEFELIKKHPAIGATIIESISYFAHQSSIVRHHHERWDGRGYPDQLKGEEIPLEARILAVADTYDAMTSDRPYRSRMSKDKALTIIKECMGTQFDPEVVQAFLKVI